MEHPQFQKRAVVSSFIFQFPDAKTNRKPRVALFKRSEKVSTYRHHLAPISGSIELSDKSPVATAWREIAEETTLTPSSLTLWRKGKPYTFCDASVNREWTVHPFAFRLKSASDSGGAESIHIDWEHESWDWYDPDDVTDSSDFGGVPHLQDSLKRVWFEAEMGDDVGKSLAEGLERLQNDHESGSRELTTIALAAFREVAVRLCNSVRERRTEIEWPWHMLRLAAWHIWKNGRESMGAATLNALISVLADMEEIVKSSTTTQTGQRNGSNGLSIWDDLITVIDRHLDRRKSMTARMASSLTTYLCNTFQSSADGRPREKITILTLSASSTIRDTLIDAFSSLNVPTLDLRILESRPLFEGVSIASSLSSRFSCPSDAAADRKLQLTIYTDASAAVASANIDVLLLGADRISASEGVSNKTGSLPAVLAAKHVSPATKVLVLSELEKVAEPNEAGEHAVEENDPAEVTRTWHISEVKGLDVIERGLSDGGDSRITTKVKNIYFEWVPSCLVDAFICEEGILKHESIRAKSQAIGAEVNRLFGNL